jgi:catechol 2,3-dioxygenase-like lactoylglutathione lyase family enzyme
MAISLKFSTITVTDVDEALGFYRDGLGLTVVNDVAYGGRWVTLGADGSDAQLVLESPEGGRSEADADALRELVTKGVMPLTVFKTDDLDATWERVLATGAEVLQEPMEQSWGPRDCAFRDPSGNTIRIAQA